ncbi:PH domain-containing protein [Parapedobacter sp.]
MRIDPYINDGQDPIAVEKLLLKLQDMLAPAGEEITYIAVQKKPAVTLFPNSLALTNKRIFICKSTKWGLATDFDIVPWKDIEDLSFKEGILGSQVTFTKHDGETLTMAYIPKEQVRKLYRAGMEALQAPSAADGANGMDTLPGQLDVADPGDELTIKLKKLKTLFERELITEAEYENKKRELLSQL